MDYWKVISLLSLFLLTSCISKEPVDIHLHTDMCAHCHMVISDEQFASQFVTNKGKSYKFDAVECMAAYVHQNQDQVLNAKLYVSDYQNPGEWLLIEQASLYRSEEVKSPMGLSLFALKKNSNPADFVNKYEKMSWNELKGFVHQQWQNREMSH